MSHRPVRVKHYFSRYHYPTKGNTSRGWPSPNSEKEAKAAAKRERKAGVYARTLQAVERGRKRAALFNRLWPHPILRGRPVENGWRQLWRAGS